MADTYRDAGRIVAAAWSKVLRIEHVDPDADFFDLGGDSLAAARVCAAIQADTGQALTLRQFAANRTMRDLASLVESMPRRSVPAARVPAGEAGRSALPVLPAQEIYLRRDAWSKKTGIYDNGHAVVEPLRFHGGLDAEALGVAVVRLGRHHAALRARFGAGAQGDDYVLRISGEDVRLRIHDADDIEQVWKAFDRTHRTWRDRPGACHGFCRGPRSGRDLSTRRGFQRVLDALAHAVESYRSLRSTARSRALAGEALTTLRRIAAGGWTPRPAATSPRPRSARAGPSTRPGRRPPMRSPIRPRSASVFRTAWPAACT
jgi:acyl carrier protein